MSVTAADEANSQYVINSSVYTLVPSTHGTSEASRPSDQDECESHSY